MKSQSFLLTAVFLHSFAFAAPPAHWIVAWGASPSPQWADETRMQKAHLEFSNQTVREIVHLSTGSGSVRVRLSNVFGTSEIQIGAAHIARQAQGSTIATGSDRTLTFSGQPTVTIPKNATVLSDPVPLEAPAGGDLAISLFVPQQTTGAGIHYAAQQTSYQADGNVTGSAQFANAKTFESWVFLSDVDVLAPTSASTLAAFGDSITDGAHSSVDANHRWPDFLAARLREKKRAAIGVLDAGIGGNRILHDAGPKSIAFGVSALARFDRDVLAQPGIKYVIVLEGINDLGHAGTSAPVSETVSAQQIIAGLQQLAERAHENGLKIYGATLTPFEGTAFPGYYSPKKETKRETVNAWIRTGRVFDGVIDFDKAVQDPAHPRRMLPAFDSGDHLHPNDAGYQAMGNAIDLSLFR
jgi:lysophospholipase L1-like esterase